MSDQVLPSKRSPFLVWSLGYTSKVLTIQTLSSYQNATNIIETTVER